MSEEDISIEKKIALAKAALDRQFGKGTVMKFDEDPQAWPAISTGAFTLDMALGIGGLPEGRMVEVYGNEGVGKSTLCLTVVANAQKAGGKCMFIDAEHALDPVYARRLGVDLDELVISQPSYGEEALEVLEKMMGTGGFKIIVIDSVAALVPKAELEGTMEDQQMGLQARMMSKAMRKIPHIMKETNTMILFTNQIREKMVMYGDPRTTPGGRALKFNASVRLELRVIDKIKRAGDGEIEGVRIKSNVIKNRMAAPYRTAEFDLLYGRGFNYPKSVVEYGMEKTPIITKKGSWFSYGDQQLGQGMDNAYEFLASDLELMRKIEKEVAEYVRGL